MNVMAQNQPQEPTIVFNKKEYPLKSLGKEVIRDVQALRFAEAEIKRLRSQIAVMQTAANAYRAAIIKRLPGGNS